jgi:hypothetical protein
MDHLTPSTLAFGRSHPTATKQSPTSISLEVRPSRSTSGFLTPF